MKAMFGQYIKKLRTNKGLTLTQLAFQLDLDSANLSKIENGKREFDEKRLDKLAIAFQLDMEKLKIEYFADQFAKKMYQHDCAPETLMVAEEKVNYLKNINLNKEK